MGQNSSTPNRQPRERPIPRRSAALRPTSAIFSRSNHGNPPQARPRSIQIPNSTPRPWSPHPRALSPSSRRRSRLSRVRSSVIETMPNFNIFNRRTSGAATRPEHAAAFPELSSPPHHSRHRGADRPRLPRVQVPDLDLNFENPVSPLAQPIRPDNRRPGSGSRSMSNIADRIGSLTPARELSRLTASLRRRHRHRRGQAEDNAQMLTRLLSVAAAATAASLMGGNPEAAVNDLRNAADAVDGDDGTFDGFLQALRSGRLASHLGQSDRAADGDGENPDRNPASLDFFRMFRFGSSNGERRRATDSLSLSSDPSRTTLQSTSGNSQAEENATGSGGRMVPILIVGIRSLNGGSEAGTEQGDAMPSFLDALTNFPTTINIGLSNQNRQDGYLHNLRHPRGGPRLDRRRRESTGGLGLFSGERESTRRPGLSDRPRPQSEIGPSTASSTPSGPYPPPTTPSSPPLSVPSTGTSTPNRRLSMPAAGPSAPGSSRLHDHGPTRPTRSSVLDSTAEEPQGFVPHRRRMSDSDHMRYGSGDSRRNGMVGTDNIPPAGEGNRSWIIYVLGGSYPENHPILTTPSLFTDSPTYEDMLLLSSLLGPAKPPVANAEDVASAGGLFSVIESDGRLFAEAINSGERMPIIPGENCLVCLSPYVPAESARRLKSCGHLFHRECIDQWLTTGRNSCPLCRSQGVDEKGAEAESPGEGPSMRPSTIAI